MFWNETAEDWFARLRARFETNSTDEKWSLIELCPSPPAKGPLLHARSTGDVRREPAHGWDRTPAAGHPSLFSAVWDGPALFSILARYEFVEFMTVGSCYTETGWAMRLRRVSGRTIKRLR